MREASNSESPGLKIDHTLSVVNLDAEVSKVSVTVVFLTEVVLVCAATGLGRCKVDNGGCWQDKRGDVSFSACMVSLKSGSTHFLCYRLLFLSHSTSDLALKICRVCTIQEFQTKGCTCPIGFKGDGVKDCTGMLELLTLVCT